MKGIVKTVTAVLSISMLASLASCSLFDKSKEECIEVGDEFVEAALAREIDDCIDVCIDEDDAQILKNYEDGGLSTVDYEVLDAIIENATFEADEKSADCSKKDGVGSIDYIISVPDFEAAMDEEPEDIDEFIDILADIEETQEYIVTLEFELDDEDWFISNPEDFMEDFYDKVSDNGILFVNYEELIDYVYWYYDSNDGIELDIIATDEDFVFEFYYVVTYNTEVVYTSASLTDSGYYIEASFNPDMMNADYLPAGSYTITFYALNDEQIASSSIELGEPPLSGNINQIVTNGDYSAYIDQLTWWNVSDSCLELDIIPTYEASDYELTWEFYFEVMKDDELIFTSDITTDSGYYIEAYFYPTDIGIAAFEEGVYTITFFSPDGLVIASDSTALVPSINGDISTYVTNGDYSPFYDRTEWWYADTSELELDIITNDVSYNAEWNFYFEVYQGTTMIFRSEDQSDMGMYIEAYFYPSDIGLSSFAPGEYTIVFFDLNGVEIARSTTTIEA
ncbi:MAG: hypothetical protein WCX26_05705 [Saccharofermentanales bacterium]